MKRYRIHLLVKKEDALRLGDAEIIRGATEGAPYQWTFVDKEPLPSWENLIYTFERWEDA